MSQFDFFLNKILVENTVDKSFRGWLNLNIYICIKFSI